MNLTDLSQDYPRQTGTRGALGVLHGPLGWAARAIELELHQATPLVVRLPEITVTPSREFDWRNPRGHRPAYPATRNPRRVGGPHGIPDYPVVPVLPVLPPRANPRNPISPENNVGGSKKDRRSGGTSWGLEIRGRIYS